MVSRRAFLELGAAGLMSACSGCAGPIRNSPDPRYETLPAREDGRVALTAFETLDAREALEHIVRRVTDMRWLSRGDSVFIKIACNSPGAHPAVTSPEALEAMVGFLRDRGAGVVYTGDQAGVEHVRRTRTGRVRSTRELMARNGLLDAATRAGAVVHCFDEQEWNGYFAPKLDFDDHWENQLYMAKVLERVDHVVVLSRLSAHAVAGSTCGIKNAVGWLRDDSRCELHQRGASFFEKIAEINHARPLRDKMRLAVTLGRRGLLDIGPDFGGEFDFASCAGIASCNLVDHDAVATALLDWMEARHVSIYDLYSPYPGHVNFWNKRFVESMWGESAGQRYQPIAPSPVGLGPAYNRALTHLAWLQQARPGRLIIEASRTAVGGELGQHLEGFGRGWIQITEG